MPTAGFASSGSFSSFAGNASAGANSIYLTKVTLINAATISAVLINVVTGASVQFKALIYDGSHSVLLAAGSTVSSMATGYNRLPLTASVSLSAGTYYVGYVCGAALSVTIATLSNASWWVSGSQSVTTPANPLVGGSVQSNSLAVALEFDGTSAQGYGWGSDYSSGVTLSASNTVAAIPAAGGGLNASARGVIAQSVPGSGKYYAEIVPSATSGTDTFIGIASASVSMANIGVGMTGALYFEALRSDGAIVGVVTPASPGLSYAGGDVIGIAYDAGGGLAWFNKNNGTWQGNGAGSPSAGTNGLAVAPGNWPMMPFANTLNAAHSFTLYDYAASLHSAPPSGFAAWSSYVVPSVSQARALVLA